MKSGTWRWAALAALVAGGTVTSALLVVGCSSSHVDIPRDPRLDPRVRPQLYTPASAGETWIIQTRRYGVPLGEAMLRVTARGGEARVVSQEVSAEVACVLAGVRVRQELDVRGAGDAVAVEVEFDLPAGAIVSDFVLTVDGREIRAIVAEEKEAAELMAAAIAEGRRATLVEADAGGRYRQSLGNLRPGTAVRTSMTYHQSLTTRSGRAELVLPTMVAERSRLRSSAVSVRASGIEPVGELHALVKERLVWTEGATREVVIRDRPELGGGNLLLTFVMPQGPVWVIADGSGGVVVVADRVRLEREGLDPQTLWMDGVDERGLIAETPLPRGSPASEYAVVSGRMTAGAEGVKAYTVHARGPRGTTTWTLPVAGRATLVSPAVQHARALMSQVAGDERISAREASARITRIAMQYGIATPMTSLLLVGAK